MLRAILFIFLSLTFQIARAADLLQVTKEALENSNQLLAAQAALDADLQASPKARALLFPRIEGGGERSYNKTEKLPASNRTGWQVSITQPLLDWNRFADLERSEWLAARSAIALENAKQDLLLLTATRYFDVLSAGENVVLAQKRSALLQAHLFVVENRHNAGEATVIDVLDAQLSVEDSRVNLSSAEAELTEKELQLQQLTRNTHRAKDLSPLPANIELPATLTTTQREQWIEQAQRQHFEVQLSELNIRLAEIEVRRAQRADWPVAGLNLSRGINKLPGSDSQNVTAASAQLTVPIFAGFGNQAAQRESSARELQAREENSHYRKTHATQAQTWFDAMQTQARRIQQLSALSESAKAALEATRTGYSVGSRNNQDVLNALANHFRIRSDLSNARHAMLIAGLQLKAQTGTLDLNDVSQINALLRVMKQE